MSLALNNKALDVSGEFAELCHTFAAVTADPLSNNIVFVCKTHIICFMKEFIKSLL